MLSGAVDSLLIPGLVRDAHLNRTNELKEAWAAIKPTRAERLSWSRSSTKKLSPLAPV